MPIVSGSSSAAIALRLTETAIAPPAPTTIVDRIVNRTLAGSPVSISQMPDAPQWMPVSIAPQTRTDVRRCSLSDLCRPSTMRDQTNHPAVQRNMPGKAQKPELVVVVKPVCTSADTQMAARLQTRNTGMLPIPCRSR